MLTRCRFLEQQPEPLLRILHYRPQLGIAVLPEIDKARVVVDGLVVIAHALIDGGPAEMGGG